MSAKTGKKRSDTKVAVAKRNGVEVVKIVAPDPSWTHDRLIAKVVVDGTIANAKTIQTYAYGQMGEHGSMMQTIDSLREKVNASKAGSTAVADELLIGQAVALNTIFNEMMRRAALNLGEYPEAVDRYMRLAFKAQSQSRATLESLARIKCPPNVAFVKQANIAHGPQQVNNMAAGQDTPAARMGESESQPSKLLENSHGEWMDTRATSTAGRGDPAMATVGQIHRAEVQSGEAGCER